MFPIDVDVALHAGEPIVKLRVDLAKVTHVRHWKEHFCVSPAAACDVWNRLFEHDCLPTNGQPKHLLWALLFLKLHDTERVHATLCGCGKDTFRKWVKAFLESLNRLELCVVSARRALDGSVCCSF